LGLQRGSRCRDHAPHARRRRRSAGRARRHLRSRVPGRHKIPEDLPSMNYFAPITAHPALACAALLTLSNLFMTFAWYGHLKHLQGSPWWTAALVSWGIAVVEYLLQVPANRVGYGVMSLAQLKILQEVITLSVFVPFAVMY